MKQNKVDVQLAVRFPAAIIALIDERVAEAKAMSGWSVNRSSMIRMLVAKALEKKR